ncbi:ABC transporter permease [Aegicerativicinus sediminis]|uniref:ABC transporter permease n=1 Tax=Aegicerativicinus sediminis TaxID=2893202 RepID=UPI001E288088|nr:ABC transporter permease [Aegicerativicinus sediminis]
MLKNSLKIAWRNITKRPLFSVINIIGLATGLACAFLIFMWVLDERSVDKFHDNDANLYQIMEKSTENNIPIIHDGTQGLLAEALEKDLPEVEHAITLMNLEKEEMKITFKRDNNSLKTVGFFASKPFFEVFSFPLIQGDKSTVLNDKNNIAVSEDLAKKLFGSINEAIGKDISYNFFGKDYLARITGVFQNVPQNSTLNFDYVLTKQKLLEDFWTNGTDWGNTGPQTYVLLQENTDISQLEGKIKNFLDNYAEGNIFTIFLRKFSDAYLNGKYVDGEQQGGRITYVRLFSIIAALVLLIACINFMNLSTARVTTRFKEIGIKKVVGTSRKQLIVQFLTESFLLTIISMLLAILLVFFFIPTFNFITGKELEIGFNLFNLTFLLALTVLTGFLAGSYPAFFMSGFTPLTTLKGKFQSKASELFIRKGLVVFQFMASLILIISVLIINNQVNYAMDKPIGYEKDNMIYFDLEGKPYENTTAFLDAIKAIPGVVNAGGINQTLIREDGGSSTYGLSWPGKQDDVLIDFVIRSIDKNLVNTLNIEMAKGQPFSSDLGDLDSYLLLNEEAVRLMGLENPVGAKIILWGEAKTILGVMKNFHTASIMQPISPLVFKYQPKELSMAMLRIEANSTRETLSHLREFYSNYNPGYNLDIQFLDETFRAQYNNEEKVLSLSSTFAYMAILISCLGLLGLAAFNTELRRKEIGIRKVLGSSAFGILKLLSMDFLKLVFLSIIIASPIAWYIMDKWLSQFVYKIDINWYVFIAAGIISILIATVTISLQTLKTAVANPIKSLRTE